MSHDAGRACVCVTEHRPPPLEFVEHHILPKYLGGTDVASNIVWICPTTHTNAHELLRFMLKLGALTYSECQALAPSRVVSRYAYRLASDGYRLWRETQALGLT